MKREILEFLNQDYLNNLDLIYAIDHGAKIIYFGNEGIMLKFGDMYMLSLKDSDLGCQLLNDLDNCNMLAVHNDHYHDLIKEKFDLDQKIVAYQYGYLKNDVEIVKVPQIEIRKIGMEYYDFIRQNYSTLVDEKYLQSRIQTNVFIGAFDQDKIVGFAGIHDEGSIGFVEVIAKYRRKGIARMLETYMINEALKKNELIYLQVELENTVSMRFNEKLGFKRANDIITWYM